MLSVGHNGRQRETDGSMLGGHCEGAARRAAPPAPVCWGASWLRTVPVRRSTVSAADDPKVFPIRSSVIFICSIAALTSSVWGGLGYLPVMDRVMGSSMRGNAINTGISEWGRIR